MNFQMDGSAQRGGGCCGQQRMTWELTFICIQGRYWGLGFGRLLHGLEGWLSFGGLWGFRHSSSRLRGRGRRLLGRHRRGLVGHGTGGDPSIAAALAVLCLSATRCVLLLAVLVLPSVTLVFVLANVPVAKTRERVCVD